MKLWLKVSGPRLGLSPAASEQARGLGYSPTASKQARGHPHSGSQAKLWLRRSHRDQRTAFLESRRAHSGLWGAADQCAQGKAGWHRWPLSLAINCSPEAGSGVTLETDTAGGWLGQAGGKRTALCLKGMPMLQVWAGQRHGRSGSTETHHPTPYT